MQKYCIKDLYMDHGQIAFKKGKLYKCVVEPDCYLLDSEIKKEHRCSFDTKAQWYRYFITPPTPAITPWIKLKIACYELQMQ